MSSSDQIRRKLADVSKKRADAEKKVAEARAKEAKKNESAAGYRARAARASSMSTARSYERQADSAEKAARAEQRHVADHSKTVAGFSKQEAALNADLASALRQEAAQSERDGKRQALQERRRRDQERLRTDGLVAAAEGRLTDAIEQLRAPKPEKLRVLYLTASPEGDLRVDKEVRRVKQGVQAATHRDLVDIDYLPAATPSDLLDGMTRFRPHVVHFSGHANPSVLGFDTEVPHDNPGVAVTAGAFARVMAAVDEPPLLVVLNACESSAHLSQLVLVVPAAIGMTESIGDEAAATFAARFYTSIADGQSIGSALAAAQVQMELDGHSDADLPVMETRPGSNAATVQLVIPPPA